MASRRPATIAIGFSLAILAVVGIGAAGWFVTKGGHPISPPGEARVGGAFSLVDYRGQTVTDKHLLGRLALIHFGHTSSTYETPAALQVMAATIEAMGRRGEGVTPVFITLDPEQDRPPRLAELAARYHPGLRALTGGSGEITAVAKAFHVVPQRLSDQSVPGGYTIAYPALIYLMDKNGRFAAVIELGTPVNDIVSMINKLL